MRASLRGPLFGLLGVRTAALCPFVPWLDGEQEGGPARDRGFESGEGRIIARTVARGFSIQLLLHQARDSLFVLPSEFSALASLIRLLVSSLLARGAGFADLRVTLQLKEHAEKHKKVSLTIMPLQLVLRLAC